MPFSSDRLRVVISGAAGGVGLACTRAFAQRGADLILCDTDGTGLTRAIAGRGVFSRYCDVISEASVAVFAAEVGETFGSIDVLINAAGSSYVRSLGMMRLSIALLRVLRSGAGRRLIVNIAPVERFTLADRMFPYAGSAESFGRLSGALQELTRGSSIDVVAVTPQMRPNGRGAPHAPPTQPYQLLRVDEEELAARVVALVSERRPGWKIRPPDENRRA